MHWGFSLVLDKQLVPEFELQKMYSGPEVKTLLKFSSDEILQWMKDSRLFSKEVLSGFSDQYIAAKGTGTVPAGLASILLTFGFVRCVALYQSKGVIAGGSFWILFAINCPQVI